ncbi:hypothetical protein QBC37DRAFT_423264 [Rhypophila decipiens]|uniref:Vacuolar protein sorting-associated protein 9a n=1 Tax=Rhypophila decipiens TaxID=261697 RepID=A0AAN6Y6U2_9PEZI|nr:hypothetical protein QBC37DRAFT_423264 [Rhypophila decipiens]
MSPHNEASTSPSQAGLSENASVPNEDQVAKSTTLSETTTMANHAAKDEDLLDLSEDASAAQDSQELDSKDESDTHFDGPIDLMSSSIATLKPTTSPTTTTATQYLTIESRTYVDPTPPTPAPSQPPSRSPSNSAPRTRGDISPTRSDAADDDRRYVSEDEQEPGSRSEIQSIMEQFSEEGGGPGAEEVMSPRLEIASPLLASPIQHPPRKSSLEPLAPTIAQQLQDMKLGESSPEASQAKEKEKEEEERPPVPPKDESSSFSHDVSSRSNHDLHSSSGELPMSPSVGSLHRPPPPEPEPEPALPFDFHRFLEQLRNKKADPVARYLKSFLSEFGKRQWMVHEQVKIISDFLAFISNKMAQCEVWREVSDAEFDNAREGMEKLVMNRLYSQTFSPAIPAPQPIPGAKPRKKGAERPMGPGRRGQHQEDVERDEVLAQKIAIYGWVKEEHLDIPPTSESGKRFLKLAQQELLKIKSYRAPRDKIICVLNCCKVIFGLLKHANSDSSADSFMPMLIYVVLHANPEHLVSNVQYILRFRSQEKLGGEAGYYLSSLMGAVQFIENMDRTTLTITDDEFEANVEAAVSAIAEKHLAESPPPPPPPSEKPILQPRPISLASAIVGSGSEYRSSPSKRMSMETADGASYLRPSTPRVSTSSNEGASGSGSGESDEKAAITGLLRSIQRPLSTIGRMFSEDTTAASSSSSAAVNSPARTPQPPEQYENEAKRPGTGDSQQQKRNQPPQIQKLSAEEAAARQASAEAAEAQRLSRAEHANVVETLAGMFPDLDRDLISDVVYEKEGRVGLAVDACLALSA